ncbi:hypothetical protein [Citrobacter freundii]
MISLSPPTICNSAEQTLERAAASPLMYGLFALETQNESLIVGAKAQLGVI